MSTALATISDENGVVGTLMSAASLTARLQLITETMQANMKVGTDYGKIPGTPKPSLFKPGAEKLCTIFGIAPDYEAEDLSTADCVRIRVKCIGRQQGSNIILGSGIGECSSDEGKYKWRAPVCQQEFDETPADRKRTKWTKGRDKPYQQKQIRTEPADSANTVLKMAAKRAHVAMTLNVTGATAIFTQDLEDIPEENRSGGADEQQQGTRRQPQAKPQAAAAPLNEGQLKLLRGKMADAGMPDDQLCARFKISKVEDLPFSELNSALAFVADPQLEAAKQ